ncbi:hypothetical protein ECG_01246 [Echinococcus granulosus]|uniref:Expressed conserved protein n=1 Tax=Echinococcus granulosus TaxID=6210 RepID=A0A068W8G5_ECHGR|nr:hypothetical protein ECG_01246 [Echinococcus granulosus]CDS15852.1 expressed conserved protein [Echinococcus granulosus]
MNSHGESGDITTHSRRKYSRGSCVFHPDAVTAKTISRLSQGVARLSANDNEEGDSKSIDVKLQHEEISRHPWTRSNEHNFFTTGLPSDTSPSFGLHTQRSSVARVKLSLPTLNTGSKRSFSYVLGSFRPLNMNSCTNAMRPSRNVSFKTRFPYPSYCDAMSSDSSMLSITPPRSEPTASSSPVVTSSPDESHAYCFHSVRRRRWRKRRKDSWHRKRESRSVGGTDYRWNSWRNPALLLDGRGSVHRINRRCNVLDPEEDSSEEGPLKKARVTEKVFESVHRRRCRCDDLLRRTASLSPRRSYPRSCFTQHENMVVDNKKHRKPTKFRKSLLTARNITKYSPKYTDNSNESRSSKLSSYKFLNARSDEDEEGDDECSDETPERRLDGTISWAVLTTKQLNPPLFIQFVNNELLGCW